MAVKRLLKHFFKTERKEDVIQKIWELVQKDRNGRERFEGKGLSDIGKYSLILPARVIVYLTAEIAKASFGEYWKEIHEAVYHDEMTKEYAPQQLKAERKQLIEAPVPPFRTSEFLRQDGLFTFYDTPKELKEGPIIIFPMTNVYTGGMERMKWFSPTRWTNGCVFCRPGIRRFWGINGGERSFR